MKTNILAAVIALLAATAIPAHAGVSVNISFGAPVVFHPPVVVAPPHCPPPPPVCAPVVVMPPRHHVPVYLPPRFGRYHEHQEWGWERERRGWRWSEGERNHGRPGGRR